MSREELITKLVTTGHLNVPDREILGRITRTEITAAVRVRLEADGFFPPNAGETGFIYEGPQMRSLKDGGYLAINRRSSVHDPRTVAESIERRFEYIGAVVNWYIDSEWGSSVDGIHIL